MMAGLPSSGSVAPGVDVGNPRLDAVPLLVWS
jgi:hypothetical protein